MREMVESGIEWIGLYPPDWSLERLQWHLAEINDKNDPIITTQVLSLTNKRGVIPYEEKGAQGNVSKENYDGYKIAYPDTIVANSMNILIGSVGYSHYYGCVSPVYYVFKQREGNDLRFINFVMQTSQFQKELRKHANGILEIRLRVSSNDILKTKCVFPAFDEQKRIADYLEAKCTQIDSIIYKHERIISNLKEYYHASISESFDNDNNRTRLGNVLLAIEQGWSPSPEDTNQDNEWNVITLSAVKNGTFHSSEVKQFVGNQNKYGHLLLSNGDFLLTRSNTRNLVGQVCIVDQVSQNTIFSDLVYRLKLNEKYIDNQFALFMFQSAFLRQQIERSAHGSSSTMVKITHKDINSWIIYLPDKKTQNAIASKLITLHEKISREIIIHEKIVAKLSDFKKALIFEVVTGKKAVDSLCEK